MKYSILATSFLLLTSCGVKLPVAHEPAHNNCVKITIEYRGAVKPLYYCDSISKIFKVLDIHGEWVNPSGEWK